MNSNNKIMSIKNLYEKAYLCKASMDRCYKHQASDRFTISSQKHYKNFLNEKKRNFLKANIMMRDVLAEHPISNPETYEYNKTFLEKKPEIDILIKECDEFESKNYKKTKEIRKKLIENNRINLYHVTPKMTFWEKIYFKFKKSN